jgi:mercuric ion transport protein
MQEMKVEVLYFEGCPNHAPTVKRVREELQCQGLPKVIREVEVRTQAEAEALSFIGSPSVRINGLDIEQEARDLTNYGMSCRTYMEGTVRSGLPSHDLLRRALDEQKGETSGTASFNTPESCCQAGSTPLIAPKLDLSGTSTTQSSRAGSVALLSGGLAALLASTCCLGPLVLVTLGISGAWIGNLTRLEPYRPFSIAIALVALFFAWRSIYRPAEACKPGDVCAMPRTRRLYKFLFWTSGVLTLLALVYPYLAKYFY